MTYQAKVRVIMQVSNYSKPGETQYFLPVGSELICEVVDEGKSTVDLIFKDKTFLGIPKFALEIGEV